MNDVIDLDTHRQPYVTTSFDEECDDCGRTIKVRNGRTRWHLCLCPPWLRGRVRDASIESMRWTCEAAGHPKQHPDAANCVCGTWTPHMVAGAVEIACPGPEQVQARDLTAGDFFAATDLPDAVFEVQAVLDVYDPHYCRLRVVRSGNDPEARPFILGLLASGRVLVWR